MMEETNKQREQGISISISEEDSTTRFTKCVRGTNLEGYGPRPSITDSFYIMKPHRNK